MSSKDTQDPGWNDPPIFSYDKATAIQAAAASKKGTLLNKRVPFPINRNLGSEPIQENLHTNDSKKPPSALTSQFHFPQSQQKSEKILEEKATKKFNIDEVLNNLQIDAICDGEIIKRIRLMEQMWKNNKLDECVQLRIFELSQALKDNDAETADHIQKSLMVDKISQCSTWMSGIRHLINQKRLEKIS